MGKMKEVCIQIMEANGGIPEGMTIGDITRMRELEIYEWKEYERKQKEIRSISFESENSGEISKVEQSEKKFSAHYGQAREEKGSEQ
jgi:hypothetical protein